jgi:hypothetical protein
LKAEVEKVVHNLANLIVQMTERHEQAGGSCAKMMQDQQAKTALKKASHLAPDLGRVPHQVAIQKAEKIARNSENEKTVLNMEVEKIAPNSVAVTSVLNMEIGKIVQNSGNVTSVLNMEAATSVRNSEVVTSARNMEVAKIVLNMEVGKIARNLVRAVQMHGQSHVARDVKSAKIVLNMAEIASVPAPDLGAQSLGKTAAMRVLFALKKRKPSPNLKPVLENRVSKKRSRPAKLGARSASQNLKLPSQFPMNPCG